MSIDLEYAIKKDIRNNPVIRELDTRERREIRRTIWLAGLGLALLLFAAWQHFEVIRFGYRLEQLQQARAAEEQVSRHLKLQVQVLQRPQRIEQIARRQLKMVQPGPNDSVVLERVRPADPPDRSVVALR